MTAEILKARNMTFKRLGFHQMLNELSHILNILSFCIDLILTSQMNTVIQSVVHSSVLSTTIYKLLC